MYPCNERVGPDSYDVQFFCEWMLLAPAPAANDDDVSFSQPITSSSARGDFISVASGQSWVRMRVWLIHSLGFHVCWFTNAAPLHTCRLRVYLPWKEGGSWGVVWQIISSWKFTETRNVAARMILYSQTPIQIASSERDKSVFIDIVVFFPRRLLFMAHFVVWFFGSSFVPSRGVIFPCKPKQ